MIIKSCYIILYFDAFNLIQIVRVNIGECSVRSFLLKWINIVPQFGLHCSPSCIFMHILRINYFLREISYT